MLEHSARQRLASLAHLFLELSWLGQGGSSQGKRWQWQDLCLARAPCPPPHGHPLGTHRWCHPHATATHLTWESRRSWDEGSLD